MGLDAVEMIMEIEETFEIVISDGEATELITPAFLIAYVKKAVGMSSPGKWSDEEVRLAVREIIKTHLAVSDFSDDDEFVRDLGID